MKISNKIVLPQVWEKKKLKEVIREIKDGGTPSRSKPEYFGGDIGWCVVKDITPKIYSTRETLTELGLSKCSAKVWPINSVIISLGATIGQVGIAKIPVSTKQGISGIVVNENLLNVEYLVYYLNFKKEFIQESATGATIKEIRPTKLAEIIEIPLPPLSEQQRIVAILDDAFAKIEKAKANAEQNLKNSKEFFENTLYSIFSNNEKEWKTTRLGDVCTINDGTHFSPKNSSEGKYMYVTAKNIKPYFIDLTKISFISEKDHNEIYSRCSPVKGDVLYIKDGATAGIATINTLEEEFSLLSSVALLKCSSKILNTFLVHYMNSAFGKKNFLGYIGGAAITRLTLVKIKNVNISLPPLKKQIAITQKIDDLQYNTNKLETIYKQKLKNLEELKKSILYKAFSGEI